MKVKTRAARHVVVVDNRELARAIGQRIRRARQAAGLTQRELAGERYTPAYISALETGSAKPSMAALQFIAERLGVEARSLISEPAEQIQRSEADLRLAAGDYAKAADLYEDLLRRRHPARDQAALQLGLAEALCRLDRGREALGPASEAHATFQQLGQPAEAALAAYWLSAANSQSDNPGEARSLVLGVLGDIRSGLRVNADFRVRVLIAVAMAESQDGEHEKALAYLEEARALQDELDDLRRARYLFQLAVEYQETGDYEAALRVGTQSAALFAAAEATREICAVENMTALVYAEMGSIDRAASALARAQELAGALPGDERFAAHLADTEAQVRLAEGDMPGAEAAADRAIRLAGQAGIERTVATAQLTRAEILGRQGRHEEALAAYQEASDTARRRGGRSLLRKILAAQAGALTQAGRLEEATTLYQEALKT